MNTKTKEIVFKSEPIVSLEERRLQELKQLYTDLNLPLQLDNLVIQKKELAVEMYKKISLEEIFYMLYGFNVQHVHSWSFEQWTGRRIYSWPESWFMEHWVKFQLSGIDKLKTPIPYPAALLIKQVKDAELFKHVLVAAPPDCFIEPVVVDPVVVGLNTDSVNNMRLICSWK